MPLAKGQQAPEIELYTDAAEPFKLSDHRGKKVLLLFFPGAFTSVCTDEMNAVNNELGTYTGQDVEVVGVSTDSPFVLKEFKKVHGLQFPLLSDHDGEVSEAYGAKYHRDFTDMGLDRIAKRAAFVVGADGKLQYAEVLDNAGNQPDFDAIKGVIANGS